MVAPGGNAHALPADVQQAVERFVDLHTAGEAPRPAEFAAQWEEPAQSRIRERCERFLAFDRMVGGQRWRDDELAAPAARQFGDFLIQEELGRGGMGIVYLAHQRSLDRRVALKVMASGLTLSRRHVERFRREATTAAQLRHPGIVPVHSFAEVDGTFAFAMDYIAGRNLGEILDDLRLQNGPEPQQIEGSLGIQPEKGYVAECALLCAQAAAALAAAHAAGIVHRDIKPRNLMVDAQHTVRLLDFGLAKSVEHDSISMSGEITGTAHYMSPEQTLAKRVPIDHRTDVFSLGVILYELLTLRRPFDGRNLQQIVYEICFKEPPSIQQRNPRVPRDLVTICGKALEKDPQNRYQTASELEQDLLRFLRWEPIHARPTGPLTKASKWVRRHRTETVATLLLVLAVAIAGGIAWYRTAASWQRGGELLADAAAHAERSDFENAIALATEALTLRPGDSAAFQALQLYRKDSENAATLQERDVAQANLLVAGSRQALQRDRVLALQLALAAVQKRDLPLTRSAVLDALGAGYRTVPIGGEPVLRARLSPDGRHVATVTMAGPVAVFDSQTGTEVLRLRGRERMLDAAFHPDGQRLATADAMQGVTIWDLAGSELLRLPVEGIVDTMTFDDDGGRLLCTSYADPAHGPWRAQVFDTATGQPLGSCEHTHYVEHATFSACGTFVASAGDPGFVRLWLAATGAEVARLPCHGRVRDVAFSADGTLVAVACGAAARVFAVDGGHRRCEARHANDVNSVAFDRAGRRLLTAARDNTARLWELDGERALETNVFVGGGVSISSALFDGSEQRVITGCDDCVVRLYDAEIGTELMQYEAGASIDDLAVDDTSHVLIRAGNRRVLLWHLDDAQVTKNLQHRAFVRAACFHPDGKHAITAADDACVRVWSVRDGVREAELRALGDPVHALDVDPKSQRVVIGTSSGSVELHSLWEGRKLLAFGGHGKGVVHVAAFAADGERVVTCGDDGRAVVWNARDAMPVCVVQRPRSVVAAALSPKGTVLATIEADEAAVQLWSVPSGEPLRTVRMGDLPVRAVAFAPAGDALVTAGEDGAVRHVRLDGTQRVLGHAGTPLGHVAFAPDGRLLLTCSAGREHVAHLWDAVQGTILVRFTGHVAPITGGAISADGRWAITCSKDRTARIWPTDPVAMAAGLDLPPLTEVELQRALGEPVPVTTPTSATPPTTTFTTTK